MDGSERGVCALLDGLVFLGEKIPKINKMDHMGLMMAALFAA